MVLKGSWLKSKSGVSLLWQEGQFSPKGKEKKIPSPQNNQQEKKSYNERHLFGRQKRNGLGVEVGGLKFLSRVGMGRGTRHLPRQKPGW